MLSQTAGNIVERDRILRSIEETSMQAIAFAEASYSDRVENYPPEILSPYLTYSLYQAAIVQYRLWKQTGDPMCTRRLNSLKSILGEFTSRWMVVCKSIQTEWNRARITYSFTNTSAGQYLEILENLSESWPPIAFPFQGLFISTGSTRTVS